MIRRLQLSLVTIIFSLILTPLSVSAFGPFGDICSSSGSASSAVCSSRSDGSNPLVGPHGTIGKITNIIAYIAGAAAIILILVGALRFITAGGDSNKAASARSTVTNALIGLAVIALGTVLIDFVLSKL